MTHINELRGRFSQPISMLFDSCNARRIKLLNGNLGQKPVLRSRQKLVLYRSISSHTHVIIIISTERRHLPPPKKGRLAIIVTLDRRVGDRRRLLTNTYKTLLPILYSKFRSNTHGQRWGGTYSLMSDTTWNRGLTIKELYFFKFRGRALKSRQRI